MDGDPLPGDGGDISPTKHLTWGNVGVALSFLLVDAALGAYFRLGLTRSLLTAAARCVLQLFVMSLVLDKIFAANSPFGVAGMALILNLLAAYEVTMNKAKRRYEGMFMVSLTSMAVSCVPLFAVASRFAMSSEPWWAPSKYIPALGMALGNAISSITIATSFTLEQFHSSRDKVETLLAHGASRFEACRPLAKEALRLALVPVINQMSVIGLISLPGMFTGSVLSGANVDTAFKLQVIIIYCITASSALAALMACIATCAVMVDERGRIRPERSYSAKDGRPPSSSRRSRAPKWYDLKAYLRAWRRRGDIHLR